MKLETKLHLGAMGYRDVRSDGSLWAKPVGKALLAYRNSTLYLLFRAAQSKPECWQHEVLNEDEEEDFPDALAGAEAMILSGTIESVLCPKGKRGFAFVDTLQEVEFLLLGKPVKMLDWQMEGFGRRKFFNPRNQQKC